MSEESGQPWEAPADPPQADPAAAEASNGEQAAAQHSLELGHLMASISLGDFLQVCARQGLTTGVTEPCAGEGDRPKCTMMTGSWDLDS